MHNGQTSLIRAFTAGLLMAAFSSALRAETTGEAYLRLAQGISGLTYGDVLWQRPPSYCETNPDLKTSFENFDQAMAIKTTLAELTELSQHPEPKVRTLAMMKLYNMEDPAAFRVIDSMKEDPAGTFPSRNFLTEDPEHHRMLLETEPMTVSKLSSLMLDQAGFAPFGMEDSAIGGMIEDWTGWYQYLYFRATGRTSPILAERDPKIAAVRRKIDALPPTTRAWMLLAIGVIDLHTNEGRDPREGHAKLFATEEELIAAAKQLGPDVLIAFLRNGTRTGLRNPKCTGPGGDSEFILDHAGLLFRKEHAEALKSIGKLIAAADADPERAAQFIREEIDLCEKQHPTYGRGRAIAALLDLCGDREADFIVHVFYEGLKENNPSFATSQQQEFIREVQWRKPKEWRKTLRGIVAHPGFEDLENLSLIYFALLTADLGKAEIPTSNDNGNLPLPQIRNRLRAYFDLPKKD